MANERQSAGFAAQRAGSDPQEARFRRLERISLEIADQYLVLLAPVVVDGIDQVAAKVFRAIEVGYLAGPKFGRQGKFRTRHQPMREVIALRVIHKAVGGDGFQRLLQFVQILGAADLALVGHTKDEIAESERISQNAPQIFQQRWRSLAEKRVSFCMGPRTKLGPAGLQHYRHVWR